MCLFLFCFIYVQYLLSSAVSEFRAAHVNMLGRLCKTISHNVRVSSRVPHTRINNSLLNFKKNSTGCAPCRLYTSNTSNVRTSAVASDNHVFEQTTDELDFEDAEKAFANKNILELLRSMLVLRMCSYRVLVDNALKLMDLGHRILGQRLFTMIMKGSFYGHFVAGERSDVGKTVARLSSAGIGSMLHITAEDTSHIKSDSSENEQWYDENAEKVLECLELQLEHCDKSRPLVTHIKISSFINSELLKKVNHVLEENGRHFDNDTLVNYKNFAAGLDGNLQPIPELSEEENKLLSTALQRLNRLAQKSVDCNIAFMVDAEQYNLRSAMAMIVVSMMSKFNREKTLIWNTYQAYLKETLSNIRRDVELAKKANFGFGYKIVRGAYMENERRLALKHGIEYPINETYDDTSAMYNKCVEYSIKLIRDSPRGQFITMVATHNENSVRNAVALMKEAGIEKDSGQLFFGQLLGMCDHVSYNLGDAGYLVYKSVPYGPIRDVMPNMSRRAAENKSVFARLDKEKKLVGQAFKKRMLSLS
ncbi:hydroxyproline dehydrogenase-like [Anneissia japonica]|uniref:hydroxyproline dehydrogenase-like n=1 Tax=Anneissia japonica TaxID=1529436 RepID=UPI0014255983|nr:hydroxyproline dehydrogenase-like [Anneissia japonica]